MFLNCTFNIHLRLRLCGIEKYEKRINATLYKFIKRLKERSKLYFTAFFLSIRHLQMNCILTNEK